MRRYACVMLLALFCVMPAAVSPAGTAPDSSKVPSSTDVPTAEDTSTTPEAEDDELSDKDQCHSKKESSPYHAIRKAAEGTGLTLNQKNRLCRMCLTDVGCKFCAKDSRCAVDNKFWMTCTGDQVKETIETCGPYYGCMNQYADNFDPLASRQSLREGACKCVKGAGASFSHAVCLANNKKVADAAASTRKLLPRSDAKKAFRFHSLKLNYKPVGFKTAKLYAVCKRDKVEVARIVFDTRAGEIKVDLKKLDKRIHLDGKGTPFVECSVYATYLGVSTAFFATTSLFQNVADHVVGGVKKLVSKIAGKKAGKSAAEQGEAPIEDVKDQIRKAVDQKLDSYNKFLGTFILHLSDLEDDGRSAGGLKSRQTYWTGLVSVEMELETAARKYKPVSEYMDLMLLSKPAILNPHEMVGAPEIYLSCSFTKGPQFVIRLNDRAKEEEAYPSRFVRFYRHYGDMSCFVGEQDGQTAHKDLVMPKVAEAASEAGAGTVEAGEAGETLAADVTLGGLTGTRLNMLNLKDETLGQFLVNFDDFTSREYATGEKTMRYWTGESEVELGLMPQKEPQKKAAQKEEKKEKEADTENKGAAGTASSSFLEDTKDEEKGRDTALGFEIKETRAPAHDVHLDSIRVFKSHESSFLGGKAEVFVSCSFENAPEVRINVFPKVTKDDTGPDARLITFGNKRILRYYERYGVMACMMGESDGASPPVEAMKVSSKESTWAMGFSMAAEDAMLGNNLVSFENMAAGKAQLLWLGDAELTLSTPKVAGDEGTATTAKAKAAEAAPAVSAVSAVPVHHIRLDKLWVFNSHENSGRGDPEIYVTCALPDAPSFRANIFPNLEKGVETGNTAQPRDIMKPFLRWRADYGRKMLCSVYESDGAPPINNLQLTLGPAHLTMSVGSRDELLGSVLVHFDDLSPGAVKEYHVGEAKLRLSGHGDNLQTAGASTGSSRKPAAAPTPPASQLLQLSEREPGPDAPQEVSGAAEGTAPSDEGGVEQNKEAAAPAAPAAPAEEEDTEGAPDSARVSNLAKTEPEGADELSETPVVAEPKGVGPLFTASTMKMLRLRWVRVHRAKKQDKLSKTLRGVYVACVGANAPQTRFTVFDDAKAKDACGGTPEEEQKARLLYQDYDSSNALPFYRYYHEYGEQLACVVMNGKGSFPKVKVSAGVTGVAELDATLDENGQKTFEAHTGAALTAMGVPPTNLAVVFGPSDSPLGQFIMNFDDFTLNQREVRFWTGDVELSLEWLPQAEWPKLSAGAAVASAVAKSPVPGPKMDDERLNQHSEKAQLERMKRIDLVGVEVLIKEINEKSKRLLSKPPNILVQCIFQKGQKVQFQPVMDMGKAFHRVSKPALRFYRSYGSYCSCKVMEATARSPIKSVTVGVVGNLGFSMSDRDFLHGQFIIHYSDFDGIGGDNDCTAVTKEDMYVRTGGTGSTKCVGERKYWVGGMSFYFRWVKSKHPMERVSRETFSPSWMQIVKAGENKKAESASKNVLPVAKTTKSGEVEKVDSVKPSEENKAGEAPKDAIQQSDKEAWVDLELSWVKVNRLHSEIGVLGFARANIMLRCAYSKATMAEIELPTWQQSFEKKKWIKHGEPMARVHMEYGKWALCSVVEMDPQPSYDSMNVGYGDALLSMATSKGESVMGSIILSVRDFVKLGKPPPGLGMPPSPSIKNAGECTPENNCRKYDTGDMQFAVTARRHHCPSGDKHGIMCYESDSKGSQSVIDNRKSLQLVDMKIHNSHAMCKPYEHLGLYIKCSFPDAPQTRLQLGTDRTAKTVKRGQVGPKCTIGANEHRSGQVLAKAETIQMNKALAIAYEDYGDTMVCGVFRQVGRGGGNLKSMSVGKGKSSVSFDFATGAASVALSKGGQSASVGFSISSVDTILGTLSIDLADFSVKEGDQNGHVVQSYSTGDAEFKISWRKPKGFVPRAEEMEPYHDLQLNKLKVYGVPSQFGSLKHMFLLCTFSKGNQPTFRFHITSFPQKLMVQHPRKTGSSSGSASLASPATQMEAAGWHVMDQPFVKLRKSYGAMTCRLFKSDLKPPINDFFIKADLDDSEDKEQNVDLKVSIGETDHLLGQQIVRFDDFSASSDDHTSCFWFGVAEVCLFNKETVQPAKSALRSALRHFKPPISKPEASSGVLKLASKRKLFKDIHLEWLTFTETLGSALKASDDLALYITCAWPSGKEIHTMLYPITKSMAVKDSQAVRIGKTLMRYYPHYGKQATCALFLNHKGGRREMAASVGVDGYSAGKTIDKDGNVGVSAGFTAAGQKNDVSFTVAHDDEPLGTFSLRYDCLALGEQLSVMKWTGQISLKLALGDGKHQSVAKGAESILDGAVDEKKMSLAKILLRPSKADKLMRVMVRSAKYVTPKGGSNWASSAAQAVKNKLASNPDFVLTCSVSSSSSTTSSQPGNKVSVNLPTMKRESEWYTYRQPLLEWEKEDGDVLACSVFETDGTLKIKDLKVKRTGKVSVGGVELPVKQQAVLDAAVPTSINDKPMEEFGSFKITWEALHKAVADDTCVTAKTTLTGNIPAEFHLTLEGGRLDEYDIKVKTADSMFAGTDAKIMFKVKQGDSDSSFFNLRAKDKQLERAQIDTFKNFVIRTPPASEKPPFRSIDVKNTGGKYGSTWKVACFSVQRSEELGVGKAEVFGCPEGKASCNVQGGKTVTLELREGSSSC